MVPVCLAVFAPPIPSYEATSRDRRRQTGAGYTGKRSSRFSRLFCRLFAPIVNHFYFSMSGLGNRLLCE